MEKLKSELKQWVIKVLQLHQDHISALEMQKLGNEVDQIIEQNIQAIKNEHKFINKLRKTLKF